MAHQFILTMRDLRRVHPPDKEVLRGVNISMFPGAKIGVLGLNGAGKSTLLRIIAGEDDGYQGECRVTPGFSVGRLEDKLGLDHDTLKMEFMVETQKLISISLEGSVG